MTHHTIDWIHKYRKYKSKYFELKQTMGLYNQSGGAQSNAAPAIKGADDKTIGADAKTIGADAKTIGVDAKTIGADAKTIGADAKMKEADAKTIGADAKTIGADAKTKEVDEKGEAIKNLITIKAMNGAQPTCGKISPGGLFVLVGYSNGQCCIYRMSTGEMILNEPFQTECSKINDVDWAEGSMLFVIGGDIDESYEPSQASSLICRMLYNGNESTEEDVAKDDEFTNIEIVSVKLDTHAKSIEYIQWENNLIFAGYNDNDKFKIILFKDDVETEFDNGQLDSNNGQLYSNNGQLDSNDEGLESVELNDDGDELIELDNEDGKQKGGMSAPDTEKGKESVSKEMNKDADEDMELDEIDLINDEEDDNNNADIDIDNAELDNNVRPVSANKTETEFKLISFEEHEFSVKGQGMSFNADKSKLSIIADNTIITINVNVSGSPILDDKEYITNSKIKPKRITSNTDKILLLGEGIEEIDITEPMDDTKPIEPLAIKLPNDMKLPIVCSYNPVTKNEILVCSQDKLCIYDTETKSCTKTVVHNLEPTINDVDWHSSDKRFFITITDTDIRVWCSDCDSGKQNRHITCDDSSDCEDDGEGGNDSNESEDDSDKADGESAEDDDENAEDAEGAKGDRK